MLPRIEAGSGEPALVFLHLFGSAKREWTEVMHLLAPDHRCIALDLPGFGDASSLPGFTVAEMADAVDTTLKQLQMTRFVLVGHSMSGKVALAVTAAGFPGLAGLILVAPSPPSPEPISKKNRIKMLAMKRDRASAADFLDGIVASPLQGGVRQRAIEDFIECSPQAWTAWLTLGSNEDWSRRVGSVDVPAMVITGAEDSSLPASVQRKTTMKHLRSGRLVTIPSCGHLLPMEAPQELSRLISDFTEHDLTFT